MINFLKKNEIKNTRGYVFLALILGVFIFVAIAGNGATTTRPPFNGKAFESPEAAVAALISAVRKLDAKQVLKILGPDAKDIIFPGDKVQAKKSVQKFLDKYDEKHKIELDKSGTATLFLGKEEWPYPIPIVKVDGKWYFDTKTGREEIVNRRIGANELMAIKVLEAYVQAQLEYASKDRDGDGILEFAQKILSDKGKKNGLYWPAKAGEEQSPFGPLIAAAAAEGYQKTSEKPVPFHGYYFKILKRQGKNAPGGAYDYVVNGNMVLGFGMIAYPAKYGVSGIMTFAVNQQGIIYEIDLGPQTAEIVNHKMAFNLDKKWHKVSERFLK